MKVIRNGEVWFSTLDEALDAVRRQPGAPREALSPAYSGFIRAGAIAIVSWRKLRNFASGLSLS